MGEISTIVKRIIEKEMLGLPYNSEHYKPEHKLKEDLGMDSLELVCIGIEIEKEFGIVINESEMELVQTVGELIEMVEKSVKSNLNG